jgi:hypothetical protein
LFSVVFTPSPSSQKALFGLLLMSLHHVYVSLSGGEGGGRGDLFHWICLKGITIISLLYQITVPKIKFAWCPEEMERLHPLVDHVSDSLYTCKL